MAKIIEMSKSFTVGSLIEALAGLDPSLPVILSKDAEGNNFSPLYSVDDGLRYLPENGYSGETAPKTEDLILQGLDVEDYGGVELGSGWIDAIVFWPVN